MEDLARNIQMAAQSDLPILISGAPERTLAVARLIVACADDHRLRPQTYDTAADGALLVLLTATNTIYHGSAVLIPEVQTLGWDEQAALMNVLSRSVRPLRIIATTSVDLFERMMLGRFDRALFYRLNTIHIMLPFQSPPRTG